MDGRYTAVRLLQGLSKFCVWFCLLLIVSIAAPSRAAQPFRERGRNNFYSGKRGEPGRIGYLPHINDADYAYSAVTFLAFDDWGAYELPKQSRYCFVLNNRTGDDGLITFLGVRIILVFSKQTPMDIGVLLGRNRGWARSGERDFPSFRTEHFVRNLSIQQFEKLHEEPTKLEEVDRRFEFKWHGRPINSNADSWAVRGDLVSPFKNWSLTNFLQSFGSNLPSGTDSKEKLSFLLLKFQTTSKSVPDSPLSFDFGRFGADSALITTFCPDDSRFDKTWRIYFGR